MPPKKKAEASSKSVSKSKNAPKTKAVPKTRVPRKTAPKNEKAPAPKALKVSASAKEEASPKPSSSSPVKKSQLPKKGETQMVAFVRDPQCIFTFWEVTPESIEAVKRQLQDEFKNSSMVLRVFHVGGPDGQTQLIREIFVEPHEMNRYVEINETTGKYILEIAQKTASGRTVVYARSNPIQLGESAWPGASVSTGAQWEMPAGIKDYFSEEEFAEITVTPGGHSSAGPMVSESLKKKKGRYSASHIG